MEIPASTSFADHIIAAVINRYNAHNSTNWLKWVLTDCLTLETRHRNYILQNGKLDFTLQRTVRIEGEEVTFSTDELALLHTYYYIEMHHYSFRRCLAEIGAELMPLAKSNPLVIDFGCGPCTAGLTLADWYCRNNNKTPLLMNYCGVDLSTSMLNLGDQLMVDAPFIDRNSVLNFSTTFGSITAANPKQPVIIIFSFVMAHRINVDELYSWIIKEFISKDCTLHILNQNSNKDGLNENWDNLCNKLQAVINLPDIRNNNYIFSYLPDSRRTWKKRRKSLEIGVRFNYICLGKLSTDDTSTAAV